MKARTLIIVVLSLSFATAMAQSRSFQILKEKFSGSRNVHAFTTSGFFARTVLWLAGEHEFNKSIRQVKNIRLISIPKSAFEEKDVTLGGFKKIVLNEAYAPLLNVRENCDEVSIYMQSLETSSMNRYLILIDNPGEVVAVEIRGNIDINDIHKNPQASQKL